MRVVVNATSSFEPQAEMRSEQRVWLAQFIWTLNLL